MKQLLNIESWSRKEHFQFFGRFDEPFFGVCVDIDCTQAYTNAKERGASFFLYYLHASLTAANDLEPFRYRIAGDEIYIYDVIHAGPTIQRPDKTFGFSNILYYRDFDHFIQEATKVINQVQNSTILFPEEYLENIVHYSSLPWIKFTSISHARNFSFKDSIPKISFGKMTEHNGKRSMPVSIHVNHALMDGYHVGMYLEMFQELLNGKA
ncbi:MAG: chloramphenicol acetyltransferase [Chitinophagaceae bacterium]